MTAKTDTPQQEPNPSISWLGDDTAPASARPAGDAAEQTPAEPAAEESAGQSKPPSTGKDGSAAADAASPEATGPDDAEPAVKTVQAKRAADGGGKRRRPTAGMLLKAAVAVALVASTVTAGLQWHRAETLAAEQEARRQVRERAGQFGVALLSYRHNDLKAAREKVMSMASADFAKTYDVAFTGGLEGVITQLKADATATVSDVYVSELSDTTAKAIVVLDSEVRSSAGTRRVVGSYLEMDLVLQKGEWMITDVSSIGALDEQMTDTGGGKDSGKGDRSRAAEPSASPRQ